MCKVSVVIPLYNVRDTILLTLDGLARLSMKPFEIIFVFRLALGQPEYVIEGRGGLVLNAKCRFPRKAFNHQLFSPRRSLHG